MKTLSVLVVGDVMVDAWQTIKVTGVSQEAPVIKGLVGECTMSPGGAANVAMNCKALNTEIDVDLSGFAGPEDSIWAASMDDMLKEAGVNDGMFYVGDQMTVKTRFVTESGAQLLRVDDESYTVWTPSQDTKDSLHVQLAAHIKPTTVLVMSDYNKGVCTSPLGAKALGLFTDNGLRVVANLKPQNITRILRYMHPTDCMPLMCLVVNEHEAREFLGPSGVVKDTALAKTMFAAVNSERPVDNVIVTLGSRGLTWYASHLAEEMHIPAPTVPVADVAGAGDTIVATIAVWGQVTVASLEAAVTNAAIVVSQHGTSVPVRKENK